MSSGAEFVLGTAVVAAAAVAVLGAIGSRALPTSRGGDTRRVPSSFASVRWSRRRLPSDIEVADWCDELARRVRSGSSLTSAVVEGGSDGTNLVAIVLAPAISQLARGRSLVDALTGVAGDPATASGLAVTVLRSCAELGGPVSAPLERVAATLRARDAVRQEQQAQSAQARLSARVLTFVPIGMLVLLATTDPNVRAAISGAAGTTAVALGSLLNLAGWWWMRQIIGRPR